MPLLLLSYYFYLYWLQDLENDSANSESLQSTIISPQKLENEHGTKIVLKSMKMRSMKDLLVAKKLNTKAISLLLCA